jgi:phage-related protein
MPSDWKPVKAIGPGVAELRIHTELERQVIYMARFAEAVYVLHVFEKRSRATSRGDIDLARRRLVEVEARRMRQREER